MIIIFKISFEKKVHVTQQITLCSRKNKYQLESLQSFQLHKQASNVILYVGILEIIDETNHFTFKKIDDETNHCTFEKIN